MKEPFDFLNEDADVEEEQLTPAAEEQDDNSQEQDTEEKPKVVEIAGKKMNFYPSTGEFDPPDGFEDMTSEEQQSLQAKSDEFLMTQSKQKRQSQALREKIAAADKAKAEADRVKADYEARLASVGQPPAQPLPQGNAELSPRDFGVETWEDVSQLQTGTEEEQQRYHTTMLNKSSQTTAARLQSQQEENSIRTEIISTGYDYDVIKDFASRNKIGSVKVAFDYYKLQNPTKKATFRTRQPAEPLKAGVSSRTKPPDKNKPMGWLDQVVPK